MKRTKIVCTIGPASETEETLTGMIKAGMNVARLNFSHGSYEEHQKRIDTIKAVRRKVEEPVALMLDTKGPEIRLGQLKEESYTLSPGERFTLTTRDIIGDDRVASVSYEGLANDVQKGTQMLIDDGLIELVVLEVEGTEIHTQVLNSGEIKSRKGVNVPNAVINLPALTEKDVQDLLFGIKNEVDFVAASFIRKADDVNGIRKVLEENGGEAIQIIAKIESREGVDNLEEILRVADGVMVARGDLGVQLKPQEIPVIQKNMIRMSNEFGKPVITATQMLDSMTRNPRATRAEVTDVANAVLDGSDAVMLSGETAAGKYPVLSVQTMADIAISVENSELKMPLIPDFNELSTTNAISQATCKIAEKLGATAIVTATVSGATARAVSKFRPRLPIIAVTTTERVRRQLALSWGVLPMMTRMSDDTDEVIERAVFASMASGEVKEGDLIVITAGIPVGLPGVTNTIKVHTIGDVILQGQGIGTGTIVGQAVVGTQVEDFASFPHDGILVAPATDREHMELLQQAKAIIVERGGLTSHAAIVGLNLGIPTIVGAEDAMNVLHNGQIITVDAFSGVVYNGKAKVL